MSTVHVPTAEEVAQMPEADKRELLAILADDLMSNGQGLKLEIKRGDRRVCTLLPHWWSKLPPNDISNEELARRARKKNPGITTEELVRRVKAGLDAPDADEPREER